MIRIHFVYLTRSILLLDDSVMRKYPDRKAATVVYPIRVDKELKADIERLRATSTKDVQESIRIAIREVVRDLSMLEEKEGA